MLSFPFKYDICDWVQSVALLQIFLTYLSAFLFLDDGSNESASYRGQQSIECIARTLHPSPG